MWTSLFPFTTFLVLKAMLENKTEKICCEAQLRSWQGNRKRKYSKDESPLFSDRLVKSMETNETSIDIFSRQENISLTKKNKFGPLCFSDVAIVPSRYPSRTFSKEEASALLVQLAMGLNSKSTGHPRFVKHQYYCGAIVVSCLDLYSKDWLIQRTEECSPWEKTALRNCEITELERSYKIEVHISDPIPAPDVSMKWLANQNPDLDTSRWLILEEKEDASKRHFVFKVPESSFRTVEKNQMTLYHGFDLVDVKCLGEMKDL